MNDECREFTEFYRQELVLLVAFVRRAGFGIEQAADAAQEAMSSAFPRWSTLANPRAWLRTTAYRIAVAEAARGREGVARAVAGDVIAASHTDADIVILGEERNQLLRDLATLPPRQRFVMAWHLDGYDTTEISSLLAIEPATVRSTLRHARAALKTLFLTRQQHEEGS